MWDKSKNQVCYRLSNNPRPKVRFSQNSKKRLVLPVLSLVVYSIEERCSLKKKIARIDGFVDTRYFS